eukprot:scaffold81959_cov15-Prasinocladus_malaysianus.AAC.1
MVWVDGGGPQRVDLFQVIPPKSIDSVDDDTFAHRCVDCTTVIMLDGYSWRTADRFIYIGRETGRMTVACSRCEYMLYSTAEKLYRYVYVADNTIAVSESTK